MKRYAAFLRGVNLAGHRKTSSKELVACLEGLGFEEVATFRASGNVVFGTAGNDSRAAIGRRLEKGLEVAFGFEVPVFLRTDRQVRAIAAHKPFDARALKVSKGKLQVALLQKSLPPAKRKATLAMETADDRLAIKGSELYWLPKGGVSDTDLNLKTLEKATGTWTMRTMGTIEQIASRFFAG